MIRIFVLLSTVVFALAACQSKAVDVVGEKVNMDGGAYYNVNAQELNTMLDNKDFVFINVHIPFEGNIHDTDLSIPYDQITEPSYLSQLPADKDSKIVLYCRSGRMSAIAAEELVKLGYTDIWNLKDGMLDWERAGFEIQDK
ncbi:MAG: rhodanese-like domain-containing protein [Anaerolineae bacterium]|nr:rhodanese-like domain-containing protein [Anaerolineae bacterium]MCI0609882.1 rhodanese-like domain-containing protein [Anaerolineae bacterium]